MASLGFGMMPGDAKRYHGEIDLSNRDHPRTQLILLTGRNKRVLELGPSTGYISQVLQRRGCAVTGIEIDPVAAEEAAQFCERMIVGDIERLDLVSTFRGQQFDVVMLGDVLEHMVDPLSVLVALRGLLHPEGHAVASIPNMAHGSIRLTLLNGEFRYRDSGLLDITHLRFFTAETLEELFHEAGYRITTWNRILRDPCGAELGVKEENYPSYLMQAIRQDIEAMTYQFVVKAKPVQLPIRKRAGRRRYKTADDGRQKPARPALPAEPVATSLLEVERQLGDKDRHIVNIEDLLEEKETWLEEKEDILARQSDHIANIETALHNANVQASAALHQLDLITHSRGYRLLEQARGPIRWLAPEGTRRRVALSIVKRGLNIASAEGWSTLLRRGVQVWRWLPNLRRSYAADQHAPLDDQYQLWLEAHALTPAQVRQIQKKAARLSYRPLVSIIMPVYNPELAWLREAIESVRDQAYDNWELCIADDCSTQLGVLDLLEEYSRADHRIKITRLEKNQGIASASNSALALATGDFVGMLDHDDELKPDALCEVAALLNEKRDLDFVYSDEDKKEADGRLVEPFFKPDWSPDLHMSVNYTTHFSVYRKSLIDKVGGFRSEYDGSQDYDLALRVTELTDKVGHIAKPLYSWRKVPGSAASSVKAKAFAFRAGKKALKDALARRGLKGDVTEGLRKGRYRVKYKLTGSPRVTIIIPTRDRVDILRRCIESVKKKSSFKNYEIMIVDNGSQEEETLDYLSSFSDKVIDYPNEFNFAKIINRAAKEADSDALIFLNNDTEVISADWIEAMLEHGQRPEVAAVGARLFYPDGRVQHEGIIVGLGGGSAGNIDHGGYWGLGESVRNCSAVTAACMLTRTSVFWELGGFDEQLRVAFNDVDFCLRAREKGYLVVYTPFARLYHRESATRKALHPEEDEKLFRRRWGNPGEYRDPYYNPNLDLRYPFNLRI